MKRVIDDVKMVVQGEMLNVVRQVDSHWYEGRSTRGGPSGIFPISYVDTIVEPQSLVSTPMSSLAASPLPGPLQRHGINTIVTVIVRVDQLPTLINTPLLLSFK